MRDAQASIRNPLSTQQARQVLLIHVIESFHWNEEFPASRLQARKTGAAETPVYSYESPGLFQRSHMEPIAESIALWSRP
jgi:hypothetical protein